MKLYIFLLLFLYSIYVNSQIFTLTNKGFFDSDNIENDYVVIDSLSKSQSQLYSDILVNINSMYSSPKDVISYVTDKSITINAISLKSITFNSFYKYDLNYTITFLFKDGKIRINSPTINYISGTFGSIDNVKILNLTGGGSSWGSESAIFNNKGELKGKKQKKELEIFFDTLISKILLATKNDKDDW